MSVISDRSGQTDELFCFKSKQKYRPLINRLLLVIHISAMLISCKNQDDSESRSVFRYNSATGITSLDPAFARTQENIRAVNQLFNGLLQLDDSLNIRPCIAKSWQVDDSSLVYTFILKDQVFFHNHPAFNGVKRAVIAEDFVYSFARIMDPATASDGAWIFNGIVADDHPFTAVDDTTLVIRLKKPFAPFTNLLTMAYCYVVPEEVIATGIDFGKHPVGTGPFRFGQWEDGIKLNLLRNEDYFESTATNPIPRIDAVSVSFIQSKQTELLEFTQAKLDVFSGLESSFKDEILMADGSLHPRYSDRFVLRHYPFLNTEYLAFNVADPNSPVHNIALRKAMSLAIDREAMVNHLRNNIGIPAHGGFIPKGLPGHTQLNSLYDPKRAREIVDSLGIDLSEALMLTTTKDYLDLCILAQKNLSAVGIPIEINVIPSAMLKQQKSSGDLTFFRSSWIADYPDAENYMACFYSPNTAPKGPNYTRFNDPEFDELYEQLLMTTNTTERMKLLRTMEQLLDATTPFITLYYDESIWIAPKRLIGLKVNALNHLDLRSVRFE